VNGPSPQLLKNPAGASILVDKGHAWQRFKQVRRCDEGVAFLRLTVPRLYLTPFLQSARVIYGASDGGFPPSRAF
jgi:hypothetical protein